MSPSSTPAETVHRPRPSTSEDITNASAFTNPISARPPTAKRKARRDGAYFPTNREKRRRMSTGTSGAVNLRASHEVEHVAGGKIIGTAGAVRRESEEEGSQKPEDAPGPGETTNTTRHLDLESRDTECGVGVPNPPLVVIDRSSVHCSLS